VVKYQTSFERGTRPNRPTGEGNSYKVFWSRETNGGSRKTCVHFQRGEGQKINTFYYIGRVELVASKTNPLTRLLPVRLRQDESTLSSDVIAAHHSSITWYLSRRLTEASQTQKELQEERVKRQLERTRTLGSGAAQEALTMTRQSSGSSNRPSEPQGTRAPGGG